MGNAQAGGEAGQEVRSRYEITWPSVVILTQLLLCRSGISPVKSFFDNGLCWWPEIETHANSLIDHPHALFTHNAEEAADETYPA